MLETRDHDSNDRDRKPPYRQVDRDQAWADLEAWLRSSHAYDMLDDAVMGCLRDDDVVELLADYDLDNSPENRRFFSRLLDEALSEGF